MKAIETNPDTRVIVVTAGTQVAFDLYSDDGMEYLSALWLKISAQRRLMYEVSWMGVPFIQLAEDLAMMHELVWKLQPDAIIECGIGQGGGLIFYSSMMELLGKGIVVGVDIEIKDQNRQRLDACPFRRRMELVEGSSVATDVVERVGKLVEGMNSVMVILDSDHTAAHVARELELYHRFVKPGGYLVVMDGGAAHVWDIPRDQSKYKDNHPLLAVDDFLKSHLEFEIDPHYNRLGITSSPSGFLRRKPPAS
ncbi:MAG: CmcI family methyltransferase [Verrucomicrobiae bacterium]